MVDLQNKVQYFVRYSDVQTVIVLVMLKTASPEHGERNCGGVRLEFGGLDREQQASHQHAHDSGGRERRSRWHNR